MRRQTLFLPVLMLVLAACSGSKSPEPLSLGGSGITVAPSPAASQDAAPQSVVPTAPIGTSTPTVPENLPGGPEEIGKDCAEHLNPARELLVKANNGSPLTDSEAADLQSRLDTALEHCSAGEYVTFQMEMFPESPAAGE